MVLLVGCATASSILDYKEISIDELAKNRSVYREKPPKYGFIIEGQITNDSSYGYLRIDNKIDVSMHENHSCGKYHKCSYNGEEYSLNDIRKRASDKRTITIYVSYYKGLDMYGGSWHLYADKIEGLMTMEEAAAYEAEKEAEAEAKRLAAAEADRYDPSKFTIVPSGYKPTSYTSIDLFTAVANAEKMPRITDNTHLPTAISMAEQTGMARVYGIYFYVSEVVFVSQNGTDIIFKTADNAISQNMKVDERSGLTAGQKVRLYYVISKHPLLEWHVRAIERL
ncbi:MAG: hypothetical protein FWD36_00005 [Treponema sp.]|nr:hypothetical protein [Treponema sp.]